MTDICQWRLKKGSEKKFRSGHPWVFSNELAQSPKSLPPGQLVDLLDERGTFLARGYGHPNSLISFRTLVRAEALAIDADFFARRFREAARLRRLAGVFAFSHRLIFAEGDDLPGLVVDRYRLTTGAQVFVVQSSTAGMDLLLELVFSGLRLLTESEADVAWEKTSIILANDSKSRLMEGLTADPKEIHRAAEGFAPTATEILVQPGISRLPTVSFQVDFLNGQKTGFFLDQRLNVQLTSRLVENFLKEKREIRVLDLCCYVGQWGTQLSHLARQLGGAAHVSCVDASAKALDLAARNVEAAGGRAEILKLDVVHALDRIAPRAFDVVICDPPAFIKKKKDIPMGRQAYYKMNRDALRRVAAGGIYVSCSCSGLLTDDEFRSVLAQVTATSETEVRWLARGGHSPDHPQRVEFPQGSYLKSWMGVVR